MAAATAAAGHGLHTVLVDERPTLGGQIFRQPGPGFVLKDPGKLGHDFAHGLDLIAATREAGAELSTGTTVVSVRGTSVVLCGYGGADTTTTVRARRVLVAPGAYDRPVAFPGWTLPGVLTAGGAQALVKSSRVVPGDRVAFAGSGPLALAFPAQLRHYGVNVVLALEAGPAPRLARCSGYSLPRLATWPSCGTARLTGCSSFAPACPCATAGSSYGPRATDE